MKIIVNFFYRLAVLIAGILIIPAICCVCVYVRLRDNAKDTRRLFWGPIPIINNKYWSMAMRHTGWESETFMVSYYSINRKEDFDRYLPKTENPVISAFAVIIKYYFGFMASLLKYHVFHFPFSGGFLGFTPFWRLESYLLKLAGKRVIILAYGGDMFKYSQISDPCIRHVLLSSYPEAAKNESTISKRIEYWTRNSDSIVGTMATDGIGRWDVLPFNSLVIDTTHWKSTIRHSSANGLDEAVTVIHTPNHRDFKGTEFIVDAVNHLKEEGLKIELLLIEGKPNETVREIMSHEADILIEQLIFTGYAMSALEGMASGLPVMANLENELHTRLFRRYSYLNECPVLSTTPETLVNNLRALVTNPLLREELGRAGRKYVEKYHSYSTAQYLFGSIYDKILYGKDVDLMNLFHPLKSEFNKRSPVVQHPLIENRLPPDRSAQC